MARELVIISMLLVSLVLFVVISATYEAMGQSSCLKYGYPTHRMDYKFTIYCVKRVNQTDVVVPLSSIK